MRLIPNYVYLAILCLILTSFTLNFSSREGPSNNNSANIATTNLSNRAPTVVIAPNTITGKALNIIGLTYSNSIEDRTTTKHLWKFRNGRQNSSLPNPKHTFEKSGNYLEELKSMDALGSSSTKKKNIISTALVTNCA